MSFIPHLSRRALLAAGGGIALASLTPSVFAAGASQAAGKLPGRARVLIRGGYVMTMDAAGDLPNADVLIDNGEIIAVGANLAADGAQVISADGFIVMPGLVDTHWHMWTTLMRSMSGTGPASGYFPMTSALSKAYLPSDMYYGALLSAAEALSAGITTVHDWCHNLPTIQHAQEDLRGLYDAGVRGRFSFGMPSPIAAPQPIDVGMVQRLHKDWSSYSNEGLLHLGLAWRGVQGTFPVNGKFESRTLPPEVYRVEYDAARNMDLPISAHLNVAGSDKGHIAALSKLGLLYKDMQAIHAANATAEEIQALAAAGASVSLAPFTGLRAGLEIPRVMDFANAGVKLGLSVDSTPLTGNADMFSIMKVVQNVENQRLRADYSIQTRRLVEMATIEGATTLGLGNRVGSLVKGKRADLIMINTRDLNMVPFTEPSNMLVDAAQPSNVDTVIVDGRILKRAGKLTAIDVPQLVKEASAASQAALKRANWTASDRKA
jgi:cytosine/adenosine deaminase-related metal-dependent hydrolase